LDVVLCEYAAYAEALFTTSALTGNRQKFINTVFRIEFLLDRVIQLLVGTGEFCWFTSACVAGGPVAPGLCWLLDAGQSKVGSARYVSFFGYLRARETLNLCCFAVALSGDARLPPAGGRRVVDPDAKT
jgi:hypothetical protein